MTRAGPGSDVIQAGDGPPELGLAERPYAVGARRKTLQHGLGEYFHLLLIDAILHGQLPRWSATG